MKFDACILYLYTELVWKVARYTSAAPFYFSEQDNYIDGGVLANNPSEDCLTAIQQHYRKRGLKLPISLFVSIGSGQNPSKPLRPVDKMLTFGNWKELLELLESAVSCLHIHVHWRMFDLWINHTCNHCMF